MPCLALDAATGERRWRFEPEDGYGAGLYLGDAGHGMAFAGSPAGRLYALRSATGRVEWSAQPVAEASDDRVPADRRWRHRGGGLLDLRHAAVGGVVMVDRAVGPRALASGLSAPRAGATRPGSRVGRSSRAMWSSRPVAMAASTRSIGGPVHRAGCFRRWCVPTAGVRIATGVRWWLSEHAVDRRLGHRRGDGVRSAGAA